MNEKFNPAPHDKHADDPAAAARGYKDVKTKLEQGLVETFPASDPVIVAQPAKSTPYAKASDHE